MTVHRAPGRRARLAAVCSAALAALTLTAAGATAARAGTATKDNVPVVTTNDGAVLGATAGTVNEFLGLPYAAPPTGNLRWRAPQPAAGLDRSPGRDHVRAELPAGAEPVRAARPVQRGLPVPQRLHARGA